MKMSVKNVCPECGSKKIARTIGEVSCRKCGFVIDDCVIYCE
jgi:predicted RNA-binding Zn-ribbon protein involved in translation (DUF1610 family)